MANFESYHSSIPELNKKILAGGLGVAALIGLTVNTFQSEPKEEQPITAECSIQAEPGESLWSISEQLTNAPKSQQDIAKIKNSQELSRKNQIDIQKNLDNIAFDNQITSNTQLNVGTSIKLKDSLCQAALEAGRRMNK